MTSNDGGETEPHANGGPTSQRDDLWHSEADGSGFAPSVDYPPGVEPEYRLHPVFGYVPCLDLEHPGIGMTLKHFVGQEELHFAALEYRYDGDSVWLDADDPGTPAPRDRPQLTAAQVVELTKDRPDLRSVPHAEPLVFLAASDHRGDFWGRAVAAGWVPTQQDLDLMYRARRCLKVSSTAAGPPTQNQEQDAMSFTDENDAGPVAAVVALTTQPSGRLPSMPDAVDPAGPVERQHKSAPKLQLHSVADSPALDLNHPGWEPSPQDPIHEAKPRSLRAVEAAEYELSERISYQRAINRVYGDAPPGLPDPEEELQLAMRGVELEERYGDAGPYTDFEWGMLNGRLAALRWVFGGRWNDLDL